MAASLNSTALRPLSAGLIGAVALIAASLAPTTASAQGIIRDSEIEETLRGYTDPILNAAGVAAADVDIYIIQDSSLNAFVTNGQKMFYHTGLMLAADNPNQLKGVIAHETGHIANGHLVRSEEAIRDATRVSLVSIGLGILAIAAGAPDAGAALISGSQTFALASFFRHTQVQESTADIAATEYMDASGQSAGGLLEFFEKFRYQEVLTDGRRDPYFRSHPLSSARIEALRVRVAASKHLEVKDSPEDMERFRRMQAKLYGYLESPGRTYVRYPLSDTSVAARYARAFAAYKTPDLKRATEETQALIALEPGNAYFHELLGQSLFESGKVAESIPPYRRAVELRPKDAMLAIGLGRSLLSTERTDTVTEGIAVLETAVRLEPRNGFAWRELARGYDMQGDAGQARLASAEEAYSIGDLVTAENFAERAKRELPQGSTAWRRASDIVLVARAERPRDRPGPRRPN
jgi:predicted Zn-dependent protease